MSYILDALKRAEAERERGSVPNLHARQLSSYEDAEPTRSPTWLWLLAAAALVLVAGGAGFWWWRAPAPDAGASVPKLVAKAPAPEAPVAVAALPSTPTANNAASTEATNKPSSVSKPLPTPPPVVAVQVTPSVVRTKPAPTVAPPVPAVAAPVVATAPVPLPTAKPLPQAVTAPPPAVTTPAKGTPSAAGGSVLLLSELPEALRRQIPPLTIAGAVYSDDPSQRMLLINNQTFGQGNTVAPGVQLEEIHASSSVFNFQGTRFQLDH